MTSSSGNSPLDPNLASILDSIRATVAADTPPPMPAAPRPPEAAPQPAPATKLAEAPAPARQTVEEFLAELIRPQVQAWLDANLPEIIQKLAAAEIARLIGRD